MRKNRKKRPTTLVALAVIFFLALVLASLWWQGKQKTASVEAKINAGEMRYSVPLSAEETEQIKSADQPG